MRDCASKNTRSPTAMVPAAGVVRPATQLSTVVLPAPEAPNRMVKPVGAEKSTSRAKKGSTLEVVRMRAASPALKAALGAGASFKRGSAVIGLRGASSPFPNLAPIGLCPDPAAGL